MDGGLRPFVDSPKARGELVCWGLLRLCAPMARVCGLNRSSAADVTHGLVGRSLPRPPAHIAPLGLPKQVDLFTAADISAVAVQVPASQTSGPCAVRSGGKLVVRSRGAQQCGGWSAAARCARQLHCERAGVEPTHLRLCWAVQALVLALADPVEVLLGFRIARVR